MERIKRREAETAIAPLQNPDRLEVVRFKPLDQIGIEGLRGAGHAECAVVHVPACASGDLPEFARRQVAVIVAVELSH